MLFIKRLSFVLCLAPALLGTMAQAQNDKKAKDILSAVSAKYKSFTNVKASFTVLIENPKTKSTEKQSGTVFVKGNKYRLEMAGQEVMCDGKTSWAYFKESNEVQINEPSNDKDAITPTNIFTMYDKGFNYKFIEESKLAGKSVQVIDLVPIDKAKKFFKIRLTINKADKQIISGKEFDKSGNKKTFTIDKLVSNATLDENLFMFSKANHPGVEVTDLR